MGIDNLVDVLRTWRFLVKDTASPTATQLKKALDATKSDGTRPVLIVIDDPPHGMMVHSHVSRGSFWNRQPTDYLIADPAGRLIVATLDTRDENKPVLVCAEYSNPRPVISHMVVINGIDRTRRQ